MSTQHKALELAEEIDSKEWFSCAEAADTIRAQHTLIVQMREALGKCRFDSLNMSVKHWNEVCAAAIVADKYLGEKG
jgi:hypothetical protein